jgi:hypothetical protein
MKKMFCHVLPANGLYLGVLQGFIWLVDTTKIRQINGQN